MKLLLFPVIQVKKALCHSLNGIDFDDRDGHLNACMVHADTPMIRRYRYRSAPMHPNGQCKM